MITNKTIIDILSILDIRLRMQEFHSTQEILVGRLCIAKTKLKMPKYQKIRKIVEEVRSTPNTKLRL